VYDALNVELQLHYAIKRFLLDSIDTESLSQIEVFPTHLLLYYA
jgi:hypothetical protein